ncbi:MAG: cold shock domain-containing protein [Planctomycetota bacterium]
MTHGPDQTQTPAAGSSSTHPDEIRAATGIVKWFDPRKGFGFVVGPQGQDIFVHYTVIEGDGFRALKDGCSVEYDAERLDKGWRATRVIRDETAEVVVPKRTHARTSRQ